MKRISANFMSSAKALFPALAVLAAFSSPASAQMINYGVLEDIFQEPVTTSATGTPQRASEVAADMTIITADQIRQSGVRKIPEILGIYVPGITILQEGINEFDVGIRGYQQAYNPRLLVLVDGRQIFSHDYSRTQWDNIPVNVDDIRQIEVVRGASSALFGSNATSGVVNIITYSPLYDDRNVVNATVGTQHSFQGDTTLTKRFGGTGGVKMSVGGMSEREYVATASGPVDYAGAQHPFHKYIDGQGYFKLSPDFILGGEVSVSQKKGVEVLPDNAEQTAKTTSYSARGGWSWKSPIGTLKNDNYVNQNILEYFSDFPDLYGISYPGQIGFTNNSLLVSRLEDLFETGSHTFRILAEYRHKYSIISSNNFNTYEKPIVNQDVYTTGGTWLWHVMDDLSWTNAIRYDINKTAGLAGIFNPTLFWNQTQPYTRDDFEREYGTVAANSSVVYKVTDEDTVRATYGRGVQVPSLINTGYFINSYISPTIIYQIWGDPNIKPTLVDDYSVGYDRRLPELESTAHFSMYYVTNRDLIGVLTPETGVDIYGHVVMTQKQGNVGKSYGFGGEVSLEGHSEEGYRWNGSYSYAHIHDSASVDAVNNFKRAAPQHQLRLNVGRTTGNWELDGHGQFMTSTALLRTSNALQSAAPVYVDSYYTLGGRIGYHVLDNVTVSLSGSNLTSMRTRVSPYTVVQRRVFLGVTAEF